MNVLGVDDAIKAVDAVRPLWGPESTWEAKAALLRTAAGIVREQRRR